MNLVIAIHRKRISKVLLVRYYKEHDNWLARGTEGGGSARSRRLPWADLDQA